MEDEILTQQATADTQSAAPAEDEVLTQQENADTQNAASAEEVLEKFDKESRTKKYSADWINKLVYVLCLLYTLYHLAYASGVRLLQMVSIKHYTIHVGLTLGLAFLLFPAFKKSNRKKMAWYDWIFFGIAIATPIFVFIRYPVFISTGFSGETIDIIMGTMLILVTLEASRRISGPSLSILSLIFLLYAIFGRYMPGVFMHRGYSWHRIVTYLTTDIYGIYGTSVGVSSTYIVLFIIFGEVMNKCGMGEFFIDLANAAAGTSKGGPAKIAVISSGLLGSINGSAVANVVTTGAFTIPMMKKTGYSKEFAGSVEATASVGGQLLPPIMGAAAFVMAETMGVKYAYIIKCAVIPALIYYLGILIQVQMRANKDNLHGLSKEECPKVKDVLKARWHLLIPIAFLMHSGSMTDLIGLGVLALVVVIQLLRHRKNASREIMTE